MIAENVVFVQDDDGHNYYIPKVKLTDWGFWLDSWHCRDGIVPDYAVRFDGEKFVVNIIKVL